MAAVRGQPRRKRRYTEQDLLQMPNDGRKYELVSGRIHTVPTGGRHGEIVSGIIARLYHAKPPYAVVYSEGVGFRMQGGNIRSPDASVMRRERLPQGKSPDEFIEGAPDLAVEVVSPSEDIRDLYQKVLEYFESGAQEVWLLFPARKQVYRYRAPLEVEVLHENDLLTGGTLIPNFQVRVSELFE